MIKRVVNKLYRLLNDSSEAASGDDQVKKEQQIPVSFGNAIPLELQVTPETIHNFTYSTMRHAVAFSSLRSHEFYGYPFDVYRSAIKCYQDLLVVSFIRDSLPPGAKILDVGGGHSRVLSHLSKDYECWCIDKYEGLGQGSVVAPGPDCGYKVIVDYMGDFNADLPDNYFDLVFSVSALEHCPQEKEIVDDIIKDINRVLKTGGYSLHCLDTVIDKTNCSGGDLVHGEFFKVAQYALPDWSDIVADNDLYVLPENIFDTWNMGRPYSDICVIDACAFWVKQ